MRYRASFLLLCGLLLVAALAGCRSKDMSNSLAASSAPKPAGPVYVVLPVSYSSYLDGGLTFDSEGSSEDLPVYRSVEDATKALREFESVSERAERMWAVYKLDAVWEEDAVPQGEEYRLKHPAKILAAVDADG